MNGLISIKLNKVNILYIV